MSYSAARESEQLRILERPIQEFIERYRRNPAPPQNRRTLILLPGGMGSRLRRADKKYDDNLGLPAGIDYKTIWLNVGTFLGDALKIEMRTDGQGQHRDHRNRIIVAAGRVQLLGVTPYEDFLEWCDVNGIDWFVYGYDWRLPMDGLASFFLQKFLPFFQQQVMSAGYSDPLADFALVGHSFGGMVIKLALHSGNALLAGLRAAITVGTPFYGYGGHMHRWCEGDDWFNQLGAEDVVRTISSLPGCYALCYLDEATYLANKQALEADPEFPLMAYPVVDSGQGGGSADPYSPAPGRYPASLGFREDFLQAGKYVYQALAQPLPAGIAAKFHNIRGVVDGGRSNSEGGDLWGIAPEPYDPTADSPLAYDPAKRVPGDGVQPAWSTRLVTQPPANYIAVQSDEEHMFLMESENVQMEIARILGLPVQQMMARRMITQEGAGGGDKEAMAMVKRTSKVAKITPASARATYDFIQEIHRLKQLGGRRAVDAYIDSLKPEARKAFARRVMMDMLKGATPFSRKHVDKAKEPAATPEKKPQPGGQGAKSTQ